MTKDILGAIHHNEPEGSMPRTIQPEAYLWFNFASRMNFDCLFVRVSGNTRSRRVEPKGDDEHAGARSHKPRYVAQGTKRVTSVYNSFILRNRTRCVLIGQSTEEGKSGGEALEAFIPVTGKTAPIKMVACSCRRSA